MAVWALFCTKNAVYAALFLILSAPRRGRDLHSACVRVPGARADPDLRRRRDGHLSLRSDADTCYDLGESLVGAQWPIAAVASALLMGLLIAATATSDWPGERRRDHTSSRSRSLGDALFGQWAVPFEIASLVLLVALIGAIMIARGEEGE